MKMPKPEGGEFELCPSGTHLSTCSRLIDLGTQETTYAGKPKHQRKIYLEFQIATEVTSDGQPVAVGNRYTLSSSEKSNLRKDLESWRGSKFSDDQITGFDLRCVLGVGAMLSVIHTERNGSTYADIKAISGLPKGATAAPVDGGTTYLSLDPEDFEPEVFESLSERLKETIRKSPEYQALMQPPTGDNTGSTSKVTIGGSGGTPEDVPF